MQPATSVEPLSIDRVESSYFQNTANFPAGSIEFDCALLMQKVHHEWHSREDLCCSTSLTATTQCKWALASSSDRLEQLAVGKRVGLALAPIPIRFATVGIDRYSLSEKMRAQWTSSLSHIDARRLGSESQPSLMRTMMKALRLLNAFGVSTLKNCL